MLYQNVCFVRSVWNNRLPRRQKSKAIQCTERGLLHRSGQCIAAILLSTYIWKILMLGYRWLYIVETTPVGKIDQDCRLVAFRRCYTAHPSVTFWIAGLNSGWPVYVLLLLFERLFVVVFLGCPGFSLGPTSQCYRFSIEPILLKTQKTQTNKPCF